MPLVSVIIPTYNNQETIGRAIESVLMQTMDSFEVIIVDDGSADEGFKTVAAAYTTDPRVKLLGPRVNSGPSIARNVGIEASRGAWIALLDGDDAWKPERLAHLLAISEGADFVADNLTVFDSGANEEVGTQFGSFDIDVLTLDGHLSVWPGARSDTALLKPMMRRGFLDQHQIRYDPTLRCGEDFTIYCIALCEGAVFRLTEHVDYIYTATYGPKSGKASVHTSTVTDGAAMAIKLREIKSIYAPRLTPAELEAFDDKIVGLQQADGMWNLRAALARRQVGACLYILGTDRSVRTRVRDAVARRLLGSLGPAKRERIVAHKAPVCHRARS